MPGENFLSAEIRALQKLGATVLVVPCVRHTGTMNPDAVDLVQGSLVAIDPLIEWVKALRHPRQAITLLSSPLQAFARERTKLALRGVLRAVDRAPCGK